MSVIRGPIYESTKAYDDFLDLFDLLIGISDGKHIFDVLFFFNFFVYGFNVWNFIPETFVLVLSTI